MTEWVCVGGAYDGRRFKAEKRLWVYELPIFKDDTVQLERYRRIRFAAGEYITSVLGHETLTDAQVLQQLIHGYRRNDDHTDVSLPGV